MIVASSNQGELVRLDGGWSKPETLSMTDAIGRGESTIRYGGLVIAEGSAFVTAAVGPELLIAKIDLSTWRVSAHRFLSGRFGGYPQACLLSPGTLVMVWNDGIDYFDTRTLATEQSVPLEGQPDGLACVGSEVWVSDLSRPTISVFSQAGTFLRRLRWKGGGSSYLMFSSRRNRVYASDQASNLIVGCSLHDNVCSTESVHGKKPTDLLLVGDVVMVTLEGTQAIELFDASQLKSIGVVEFPGTPRTLTYFP